MSEAPAPSAVAGTGREGLTLIRVADELRSWLADAPVDDDTVHTLLNDCDTIEAVGHWLLTSPPIRLTTTRSVTDVVTGANLERLTWVDGPPWPRGGG